MTHRQSPIGKGGEVILIQYHATFEIGPTPPFDRRETKYKSVDKGFLELVRFGWDWLELAGIVFYAFP